MHFLKLLFFREVETRKATMCVRIKQVVPSTSFLLEFFYDRIGLVVSMVKTYTEVSKSWIVECEVEAGQTTCGCHDSEARSGWPSTSCPLEFDSI